MSELDFVKLFLSAVAPAIAVVFTIKAELRGLRSDTKRLQRSIERTNKRLDDHINDHHVHS